MRHTNGAVRAGTAPGPAGSSGTSFPASPPSSDSCRVSQGSSIIWINFGQEKRIRKQSRSLMRAQRRVTSVLSVYRLAPLKNNLLKLLIILNYLPNDYKSFLAWDPPGGQRGNCLGGAAFNQILPSQSKTSCLQVSNIYSLEVCSS